MTILGKALLIAALALLCGAEPIYSRSHAVFRRAGEFTNARQANFSVDTSLVLNDGKTLYLDIPANSSVVLQLNTTYDIAGGVSPVSGAGVSMIPCSMGGGHNDKVSLTWITESQSSTISTFNFDAGCLAFGLGVDTKTQCAYRGAGGITTSQYVPNNEKNESLPLFLSNPSLNETIVISTSGPGATVSIVAYFTRSAGPTNAPSYTPLDATLTQYPTFTIPTSTQKSLGASEDTATFSFSPLQSFCAQNSGSCVVQLYARNNNASQGLPAGQIPATNFCGMIAGTGPKPVLLSSTPVNASEANGFTRNATGLDGNMTVYAYVVAGNTPQSAANTYLVGSVTSVFTGKAQPSTATITVPSVRLLVALACSMLLLWG